MLKRSISAIVVSTLAATVLFGSMSVATAQTVSDDLRSIPVTGTTDDGGTFDGTLTVSRFVTRNGDLFAIGRLTGTVTDAQGGTVGQVENLRVRLPVDASATCDILDLSLGPVDLDLLGLVVHLDEVNLQITAESGPGNLLGNLLCGIAGLLDRGIALDIIDDLLNVVLGILRL